MRPLRLVILLSCFVILPLVLTIASLVSAYSNGDISTTDNSVLQPSGLRALFSFGSPSSLFPPSAIISLTDDNTTFFVARPAAFGPLLPSKGLSGPLWVGSGFGEDTAKRGGIATGAEGELGCSDVPGWVESSKAEGSLSKKEGLSHKSIEERKLRTTNQHRKTSGDKQSDERVPEFAVDKADTEVRKASKHSDDGTDDYLTESIVKPHPAIHGSKSTEKQPEHADIQSLQESAEIAGKIVLLSRGGCGFLDKVKWVQRRGGIALIVGDDTRGGGLVTMYARGDTTNVTISSLFTSHTTAHLLSSLIPSELYSVPKSLESGSRHGAKKAPGLKAGPKKGKKKQKKQKSTDDRPIFTTTNSPTKLTAVPRPTTKSTGEKQKGRVSNLDSPFVVKENRGFIQAILSFFGFRDDASTFLSDNHRPPTSGELEWLVDDWEEDDDMEQPKQAVGAEERGPSHGADKERPDDRTAGKTVEDSGDFVIGVHDWRDPDLVGVLPATETGPKVKGNTKSTIPTRQFKAPIQKSSGEESGRGSAKKNAAGHLNGKDRFKGGSITPGSGEYGEQDTTKTPAGQQQQHDQSLSSSADDKSNKGKNSGWLGHLPFLGESSTSGASSEDTSHASPQVFHDTWEEEQLEYEDEDSEEEHEGLWVTLTPTSMSSSPFFDTLLVLVVSPLVTLTVVYALLLLRSRIRRRRWRAPKSVVDRLPVRTYQTISTPSSSSTRIATPQTSSPAAPLLMSSSSRSSVTSQYRPRSRTTSGLPSLISTSRATNVSPPRARRSSDTSDDEEKGNSKWRRPYSGKQVECVVCLEEYIDGVSKVMSLPCGHEFHVDCITPWLTTRRRTCPICKGDVVRSIGKNKRRRPSDLPPAGDDDIQARAAETINDSALATVPIGGADSDDEVDLEPSSVRSGPRSSVRNRLQHIGALSLGSIRGISAAAFGNDGGRGTPDGERLLDGERAENEEEDERRR
ncbi:MAG: hypothetical protein M1814_005632 [Vezdaea aestivalis]|nr:MAG: hypothetical protein M1814_005632 [Vezdaea aestivalis]